MSDWTQLILTIGFPSACLVAIGYAAWRVIPWFGAKVVEPWVQKQIELMDECIKSTRSITKAVDAIEHRFEAMDGKMDKVIIQANNAIIAQKPPS